MAEKSGQEIQRDSFSYPREESKRGKGTAIREGGKKEKKTGKEISRKVFWKLSECGLCSE